MKFIKTLFYFYFQPSYFITMPKYAVAVGRCVGIYDTYDECKKQVLNFPKAKFEKFDTVQEAQDFIQKFSTPTTSSSFNAFKAENRNPPTLFKVGNHSEVTLGGVVQKLNHLEEVFNNHVTSTNAVLEDFNIRILNIEKNYLAEPTLRPTKRIKLEEPINEEIDHSAFIKDHNDVVTVYTDGACVNNGKTGAKAGIGVWFNHGHSLNVSEPLRGPATNNNAEIQAARVAITQAAKAGLRKLCVHTDSQFLINCITEWINKWKKNNWKLINGKDVKNKVEIVKLDVALQKLESVEWKYVKGHKGIEGNEMADKLARDGACRYNTNVTYSDYSDL